MVFLASCSKRSTHLREMRTPGSTSCICFCDMYCDAYTATFAVTQIGVLSMTFRPPSNRADHRHPRHAGKRARSCWKLRYRDHRAAVRALHSAISARSLSCERRIYNCDLCAGWHLTSKAARA